MKRFLKRKKPAVPGRTPSQPGNAAVFSYYASRNRNESREARQRPSTVKPRKPILQNLPTTLALLAIAGSLFYVLWINTDPRISIVPEQAAATLLQETEIYRKAGQELLNESLMNRTKLTINTTAIAREMQKRFPELADVSITTPLTGHRLIFEIEPAAPSLVLASASSPSYVLDSTGRAVVKATEVPKLGELKIPLVRDESGLELSVGKTVLPSESIDFITNLLAHLKAKKVSPDELTLPTIANELHLKPEGQEYYVKFNMILDPRTQAGTYLAVKRKLSRDGVTPKEYIDVRVEEKAFYK